MTYAADDTAPDPEIDKINQKYAEQYKVLAKQGEDLSKKSPDGLENVIGVDADFSKMREVSFDIPEFRMKTVKISFDLPSVTMRLKRIVWDNPETTMTTKKIGQYPEFHGTTVKWSDIYADVPVTTMVRREIKIDIPEFHNSTTEISFDVPEIFKTSKVSFNVPEIKIRTTEQGVKEVKDGGAQLASAASSLSTAQKTELLSLSRARLETNLSDLVATRNETINNINSSITKLKGFGIDTKAIPQEDGSKLNMDAQLASAQKSFDDGEYSLKKSIEDIDTQLKASSI
jgi:hypothetical protein